MALTAAEWVIANSQDYWQTDEGADRYYINWDGRVAIRSWEELGYTGILVQDTSIGYEVPGVYAGGGSTGETALTAGPTYSMLTPTGGTMEAGADLRDFYPGGDLGGGDAAMLAALEVPQDVNLQFGEVSLNDLLARIPPELRSMVGGWFGSKVGKVGWSALPTWLKAVLIGIGVVAGTAIVVGVARNIGSNGSGAVIQGAPGVPVIGQWTANGVTFYRLMDGRISVVNSKGRVKTWRPKKPIVLYANGAGSLNTYLRADSALNKQSKRLQKALNRRAPRPRKAKKG